MLLVVCGGCSLPELVVNPKHDPALAEVSEEMDQVEAEIQDIFDRAKVREQPRTHTQTDSRAGRQTQPETPWWAHPGMLEASAMPGKVVAVWVRSV